MEQLIARTLQLLSSIYNHPISSELLEGWILVLSDLEEDEFKRAIKAYCTSEAAFFPKPGQIYNLARPRVDKESEAALIVDDIFNLLGTCGGDTFGVNRAMSRLSEVAKAYILNKGGWGKFASEMQLTSSDDLPILKSQARKALVGLLQRSESGGSLVQKPQLVHGSFTRLGDLFKKIDDKKNEN